MKLSNTRLSEVSSSESYYESVYVELGIAAQRKYPNDFFCSFVCGTLTKLNKENKDTKVLEVGCGSGANLWMLVKEGFDTYGMDFSPAAVKLCEKIVRPFGEASITVGDMRKMDYNDGSFDAVCDVFSAYCFTHNEYLAVVKEVSRILKPGGFFFFYTPCVTSRAFTHFMPAEQIDLYTLNGIYREDSPFAGNHYCFHFLDASIADDIMQKENLRRVSLERSTRTYNNLSEPFSHLVGVYEKF